MTLNRLKEFVPLDFGLLKKWKEQFLVLAELIVYELAPIKKNLVYFLLLEILDPSRLAQRYDRLRRERSVRTEREKVRIEMLRKFKDRRFCAIQGQVSCQITPNYNIFGEIC
jgi:hypothetical protein